MRTDRYLIIGSGRLAKHLAQYFSLLGLEFEQWSRKSLDEFNPIASVLSSSERLAQLIPRASHVLLAISDEAIPEFLQLYKSGLEEKICVHFSGALSVTEAISAHPLMTFADEMYDLKTYKSIPFILDVDRPLEEVLPGLTNESHFIAPEHKALYHAYCVVAGNFTSLLWKAVSERMEANCGLPNQVLWPYLRQIALNIESDPERALTGPLVRNDTATIAQNGEALSGDPLQELYKSFVRFYESTS